MAFPMNAAFLLLTSCAGVGCRLFFNVLVNNSVQGRNAPQRNFPSTYVRFYFHTAKQVFPIMHPKIITDAWG